MVSFLSCNIASKIGPPANCGSRYHLNSSFLPFFDVDHTSVSDPFALSTTFHKSIIASGVCVSFVTVWIHTNWLPSVNVLITLFASSNCNGLLSSESGRVVWPKAKQTHHKAPIRVIVLSLFIICPSRLVQLLWNTNGYQIPPTVPVYCNSGPRYLSSSSTARWRFGKFCSITFHTRRRLTPM